MNHKEELNVDEGSAWQRTDRRGNRSTSTGAVSGNVSTYTDVHTQTYE